MHTTFEVDTWRVCFLRAMLTVVAAAALLAVTFASTPVQLSYPGSARSERDLPLCAANAVCSVLHRRFWGAQPLLERFCRCPGRLECPSAWTMDPLRDNQSMQLNNRSQLKFCNDVKSLGKCKSTQVALNVTTRSTPPDRLTQTAASVSTVSTANCFCPPWPAPRHWKHVRTSKRRFFNGTLDVADTYSCAKLPRCEEGEACGVVRQDLFSIYFKCSCLRGRICYSTAHASPTNKSEVLFEGPVYEAHCL
ncbi:U-scoloptoxin(11)-Sm2a-like [Neocloeon triangulifer]|uniref:U-scoloptoxin(11)-Sm2a-like n=1 Tax=Neocloeon triangulifer TaxID=2078957 RepID=UPI00286EF1F4|nr:U-scoloptoxin(11)-Sm2a-like [Neocloeon triangulifer]